MQSSARNSILDNYEWIQLSASCQWLILSWSNLPQYQEWSLSLCESKGRSRTISRKMSFRIFSIRRRGYSLRVSVWLLFEGGVYFIGKPADINDGWIRYVRTTQRRLLDAGSTLNVSVLQSAMKKGCTTRTVLALTCACAACAACCWGYYLKAGSSRRNTVSSSLWRL